MILWYHKGQNFGDALNPMIFDRFLPNCFGNENDDTLFLGIGSILGFDAGKEKKKVVFSSGFAKGNESTYGAAPIINETYDILCVRGPLTAKALGIDPSLAITDGAALLRFFEFEQPEKEYDFSYMPHIGSEQFYPWESICEKAGIQFISPSWEVDKVLEMTLKTKVLLAEAMHGAIVADTLRVPWIPVKAYDTINEFKWTDWTSSLNMEYQPNSIPSIFSKEFAVKAVQAKTKNRLPGFINSIGANYLKNKKSEASEQQVVDALTSLTSNTPFLSHNDLFISKTEQLMEKLEYFKQKYSFN